MAGPPPPLRGRGNRGHRLFATLPPAIAHEKQIKKWRRDWKIALIERDNPDWHDRFEEISS
jgi:putative endonuclease